VGGKRVGDREPATSTGGQEGPANKKRRGRAVVDKQPCFCAAMHELLRTARSIWRSIGMGKSRQIASPLRVHQTRALLSSTEARNAARSQACIRSAAMRTRLDAPFLAPHTHTHTHRHRALKQFQRSGRWPALPLGGGHPHYSPRPRASSFWRRHAIVILGGEHLVHNTEKASRQVGKQAS